MNWLTRTYKRVVSAFTGSRLRVRRFEAGRMNRLTSGWIADPIRINQDLKADLRTLVGRSRDLAKNSPYTRRFMSVVLSNVIGPDGVKLRPTPRRRDGSIDEADARAIERAFKDWGRRGTCEVTGRLSWLGVQNLVMRSIIRDGEVFVARIQNGNRFGYSLQILDASTVDYTFNQNFSDGRSIVMGVELDSVGRVLAYWIKKDGAESYGYGRSERIRIAARDVRHIYMPDEADQVRGFPWATPVMLSLNMLDGYQEAHLVGARASAAKMGFYKQIDPSVEFGGEAEDGVFIEDAEAGSISVIPAGYEWQSHDPNFPNDSYADFIKSSLRTVASGLGVSYNSFANDLEGVNFSSMRSGVQEDREGWKALQSWLVESLHEWVFDGWIEAAIEYGALRLPSNKIDKFREVAWQPRRWQWVDPLKDMQANALAVATGLKSRADCIREVGRDPEEVWAELEAETDRLRKSGVITKNTPSTEGVSSSGGDNDAEDD